jgi:hypothetical protein
VRVVHLVILAPAAPAGAAAPPPVAQARTAESPIVSAVGTRRRDSNRALIIESAALGLGYAATLVWIGSAFVGSFGDFDDAYPYWPAIPHLRTDTAGFLAFAVAVVTLVPSRYLQLRRRAAGATDGAVPAGRPGGVLALQALADVALVLATGVVLYLSVNAAMHPWTLPVQLTHLVPWPSEGTVRVLALAVCALALAVRRYLRASPGQVARPPAALPERADLAA